MRLVIVISICLFGCINNSKYDQAEKEGLSKLTPEQLKKEKFENLIYQVTIREMELKSKDQMNDADSYERVDYTAWNRGDTILIVKLKFKGTNVYGGVVTNSLEAFADSSGHIFYMADIEMKE
jgi:hypothetical protein